MGKTLPELKAKIHQVVDPKAKEVASSILSFSFCVQAVKIITLVIFYYCFSIGLTFYNQRFIHRFKYPLSLTMAHLVIKFILAGVFRSLIELKTQTPRVTLSWGMYIKRLAPAGIASALDIGLSNWSFEFITVSLYTMSKSTAVIFILFFALIFKLEKWRWSLLLVVMFIATGLFMFTYHSTQFNAEGFAMVMTASCLSGLRWTLAQMVTQKNEIGLQNPLDMMFHIQPWMILALLPLSAGFEGVSIASTDQLFGYTDYSVLLSNLGLVLLGAVLAFMLEFSEFLLVAQTSSLTLSISGIFKELCTLYLAHVINKDEMNSVNEIGLVVCVLGIILHVIFKAVHQRQTSTHNRHYGNDERIEMLTRDGSANIEDSSEEEIFNVSQDR